MFLELFGLYKPGWVATIYLTAPGSEIDQSPRKKPIHPMHWQVALSLQTPSSHALSSLARSHPEMVRFVSLLFEGEGNMLFTCFFSERCYIMYFYTSCLKYLLYYHVLIDVANLYDHQRGVFKRNRLINEIFLT